MASIIINSIKTIDNGIMAVVLFVGEHILGNMGMVVAWIIGRK